MENYRSFNFLKEIYYVRTGGSESEVAAANRIAEECRSLGADTVIEAFSVDGYTVKKASLRFKNPDMVLECCGVGMSGSTPEEGVCGRFCYITSLQDAEIQEITDKICLVHTKLVNYKLYKRLCEKKAKALILCCGSVYDETSAVDLDPYMYRNRHYENGKIPAVCIRMRDAETVLRAMPEEAEVIMVEEELSNSSHNVVATIEGTKYKNEIIAFTAHYDSVSYSKGAYDNGTGSTAILQMLAYFRANPPLRTLKFIWCGSEEMGLLGSKAYVEAHKKELETYKLCINVDMIGVTIGYDIACCTSNVSLVSYIQYLGCENGFAIAPRQGVYSSDSTPFADSGIPAVSFARLAPQGGARIHSRLDVMDYLEEKNYYRTCDFIALFSSRLINAVVFPVEREIPDKMKEELDYYLGRKERKE